jgi:hypothetical protein
MKTKRGVLLSMRTGTRDRVAVSYTETGGQAWRGNDSGVGKCRCEIV